MMAADRTVGVWKSEVYDDIMSAYVFIDRFLQCLASVNME